MRTIKNVFFGLFVMVSIYLLGKYVIFDITIVMKIIIVFFFTLFFFNLLARRLMWFRPYFTSKYNLINSKYKIEKEYDFSKNILLHKFIEVLKDSKYRVAKYDEKKGLILAISRMGLFSWGENIYIKLEETDSKVIMYFCSASIFGVYSWGKNEENYIKLMSNFDESLTI